MQILAPLILLFSSLHGHGREPNRAHPHVRSLDKLKAFIGSYLNQDGDPPDKTTRIVAIPVPTDGQNDEELVYVTGHSWCGSGGCTLLILERSQDTFKVLGNLSVIQLPVKVLPTSQHGHPDISVRIRGDSIGSEYIMQLSFDGTGYPKDAATAPSRMITNDLGRTVISAASKAISLYK